MGPLLFCVNFVVKVSCRECLETPCVKPEGPLRTVWRAQKSSSQGKKQYKQHNAVCSQYVTWLFIAMFKVCLYVYCKSFQNEIIKTFINIYGLISLKSISVKNHLVFFLKTAYTVFFALLTDF